MDLQETTELVEFIKRELKPNTLPKEFVDALMMQSWYCQLPITTKASDYIQVRITKSSDTANRLRFTFTKNDVWMADLDFYGD